VAEFRALRAGTPVAHTSPDHGTGTTRMHNITDLALSRLVAQDRALEVTANNLANANTPGYRAERTIFAAWIAREPQLGLPRGERNLDFAQDRATYRDVTAGTRVRTGNPLDLAIGDTQGWLTVMTPNGTRLTRAGQFELGADGSIVDEDGNALLDVNGRKLQTDPSDPELTIASDGTVSAASGPIGQIGVVKPDNPASLTPEGGHLMRTDGTATRPVAAPQIQQGTLEDSNVQPIGELTRMMNDTRAFQMTTQLIQAELDRENSAITKILAKGN
jgi:flagellar basal-body rod protein FlgF